MLKFIKHNLEGIDGVGVFPMVSLIIFFIVFITMFLIVLKFPKSSMDEISQLPLEKENNTKEISNE